MDPRPPEHATSTPLAPPTSPQPIPDDRLCDRCGYNLRGLRGWKCPECGAGIERARSIIMLASAGARLQRRLSLGAAITKYSLLACMLALLALATSVIFLPSAVTVTRLGPVTTFGGGSSSSASDGSSLLYSTTFGAGAACEIFLDTGDEIWLTIAAPTGPTATLRRTPAGAIERAGPGGAPLPRAAARASARQGRVGTAGGSGGMLSSAEVGPYKIEQEQDANGVHVEVFKSRQRALAIQLAPTGACVVSSGPAISGPPLTLRLPSPDPFLERARKGIRWVTIIASASAISLFVGLWLLTAADAILRRDHHLAGLRTGVRILSLLIAAGVAAALTYVSATAPPTGPGALMQTMMSASLTIALTTGALTALAVAVSRLAIELARRAAALPGDLRRLWALPLALVPVVGWRLLPPFIPGATLSYVEACASAVIALPWAIGMWILLSRLGAALRAIPDATRRQ